VENRTAKPINKPPVLFDKTQRIIQTLESALKTTFVAYWNSSRGSVCHNDAVGFYELLSKLGKREHVALFIKSGGGTGTAALRIVHLLRSYASRLTVVIPLECGSAATMVALGADEIHMGPLAYLTAIDTSITHDLSPTDVDNDRVSVSQDELSRIVRLWRKEFKGDKANPYQSLFPHIHPLVIGAVDRASSLSIKLCKDILSYHMTDAKKAERISNQLNSSYPSHSYPITLREAQRVGIAVKPLNPVVNDHLIELNEVYSEMGQKALTDYDEGNYHDNEILNVIESQGTQVYYQTDKDMHYRKEERRWVPMNDQSSWRKMDMVDGKPIPSVFYIR
jgi:hypothetical protein